MANMVWEMVELNGLNVETLKKVFSSNLARLMSDNGVNQRQMASDLEVTTGIVSRWVNGFTFPDSATIDRMREKYLWTLVELFNEGKTEVRKLDAAEAIMVLAEATGYERPKLKVKKIQ